MLLGVHGRYRNKMNDRRGTKGGRRKERKGWKYATVRFLC